MLSAHSSVSPISVVHQHLYFYNRQKEAAERAFPEICFFIETRILNVFFCPVAFSLYDSIQVRQLILSEMYKYLSVLQHFWLFSLFLHIDNGWCRLFTLLELRSTVKLWFTTYSTQQWLWPVVWSCNIQHSCIGPYFEDHFIVSREHLTCVSEPDCHWEELNWHNRKGPV